MSALTNILISASAGTGKPTSSPCASWLCWH